MLDHGADFQNEVEVCHDPGALVLKDCETKTPLQFAEEKGNPKIVDLLSSEATRRKLAKQKQQLEVKLEEWKSNTQDLAEKARGEKNTGHVDRALNDYREILAMAPEDHAIYSDPYYRKILRQILKIAHKGKRPLALSEAYRKEMVIALDVVKEAKATADYRQALDHFLKASKLAPWAPQPYEALGHIEEALKDYSAAAQYYRLYLLANPRAHNARAIQDRIYILENKGTPNQ